jgi:hypothetical protein
MAMGKHTSGAGRPGYRSFPGPSRIQELSGASGLRRGTGYWAQWLLGSQERKARGCSPFIGWPVGTSQSARRQRVAMAAGRG